MNSSVSMDNRAVKSWLGLFFGLFCVGLSLVAWLESKELASLLSGLGFLCFTYPWSQITSWTLKDALPMNRASIALTYLAMTFLMASMALRFFG